MRVTPFSLALPQDAELPSVDALEARLASSLDECVRLLRWAIVRVENGHWHCEGAYLTTSNTPAAID